jgi:hypothetical protein
LNPVLEQRSHWSGQGIDRSGWHAHGVRADQTLEKDGTLGVPGHNEARIGNAEVSGEQAAGEEVLLGQWGEEARIEGAA